MEVIINRKMLVELKIFNKFIKLIVMRISLEKLPEIILCLFGNSLKKTKKIKICV